MFFKWFNHTWITGIWYANFCHKNIHNIKFPEFTTLCICLAVLIAHQPPAGFTLPRFAFPQSYLQLMSGQRLTDSGMSWRHAVTRRHWSPPTRVRKGKCVNKMVVVFAVAVQDLYIHVHRECMLAALHVVLDVTMVKQHIWRVGGNVFAYRTAENYCQGKF